MESKALEVNLTETKVDVTIDKKYKVLQDIVSPYFGILKRMNIFLTEVCHDFKNWHFIISETRHFVLHYFYLYKPHPQGEKALSLFVDIFLKAFESNEPKVSVKHDAVDNLMLFLQHIIKESKEEVDKFFPVLDRALSKITQYEDEDFYYFVRSYYQPDKLAHMLLPHIGDNKPLCNTLNQFLLKYYQYGFDYWLRQEDPLSWVNEKIEDQKV
ncbi:MAG: pyruvate, phosphate dikinase, partial [Desulfobacteraceae bacterium]|nr:pyruvate, phosphate dikinase [Desulfobacteraceae bacterium]